MAPYSGVERSNDFVIKARLRPAWAARPRGTKGLMGGKEEGERQAEIEIEKKAIKC